METLFHTATISIQFRTTTNGINVQASYIENSQISKTVYENKMGINVQASYI